MGEQLNEGHGGIVHGVKRGGGAPRVSGGEGHDNMTGETVSCQGWDLMGETMTTRERERGEILKRRGECE